MTLAWWRESTGEAVDADVVFNSTLDWEIYPEPLTLGAAEFKRIAIHEFGHVLGLDHADDPDLAIMYYRATDLDALGRDDVDGIIGIYGSAFMDASTKRRQIRSFHDHTHWPSLHTSPPSGLAGLSGHATERACRTTAQPWCAPPIGDVGSLVSIRWDD